MENINRIKHSEDYVNNFHRIQKQMFESPIMQDYNAQKLEKSQTLSRILNGELKNRVQELSGVRPLFEFDQEKPQKNINNETKDLNEFLENKIKQQMENVNVVVVVPEADKKIELETPKYRIAPLKNMEENIQLVNVSHMPIENKEFRQEVIQHIKRNGAFQDPNVRVPVDYIMSIRNRAEKRQEMMEKLKLKQEKFEKKLARKEFWKNFSFKEYLKKNMDIIVGKISNFFKKIYEKIDDWRFEMSLNKNQRNMFRGWKKSKTSNELINFALKKNINLNEIKNMNSRMNQIPE